MSNNNFKNSGITFGSYATFFWEKWHMNRWFAFFETIFQKPENAPQHYRIWDFFTFVFFLEIFFGNSSYNTITSKNVLKTRSKSLLALRVALTDGLPYIYFKIHIFDDSKSSWDYVPRLQMHMVNILCTTLVTE